MLDFSLPEGVGLAFICTIFLFSHIQCLTGSAIFSANTGFADISLLRLTQLASIESHCVDSLPGPQHCVEPSCCDPNHGPASQRLGEHLHVHT